MFDRLFGPFLACIDRVVPSRTSSPNSGPGSGKSDEAKLEAFRSLNGAVLQDGPLGASYGPRMSQTIQATFKATRWDETPIADEDGLPKLTRASCEQTFSGDIDGTSTLEYLMAYHLDGPATFVGIERVVGTVSGKSGSFVLRHEGEFRDGVAKMTLTVVAGAGTGELAALSGGGRFESAHAPEYSVTLEIDFGA